MTVGRFVLVCGCLVAQAGWAADPSAERRAERERIVADQARADAAVRAAEAACQRGFLVSSCLERARAEHRGQVDALQQQRMLIDADERKERAGRRLQQIEDRQRALQASVEPAPAAASAPAPAEGAATPAAAGSHVPHGRAADTPQRPRRSPTADAKADAPRVRAPAPSASQAERRAADQRARADEAAAHRAAVEQRNAQHALQKKPAAPLPEPPAGLAR